MYLDIKLWLNETKINTFKHMEFTLGHKYRWRATFKR